jgi:hypothetical protein
MFVYLTQGGMIKLIVDCSHWKLIIDIEMVWNEKICFHLNQIHIPSCHNLFTMECDVKLTLGFHYNLTFVSKCKINNVLIYLTTTTNLLDYILTMIIRFNIKNDIDKFQKIIHIIAFVKHGNIWQATHFCSKKVMYNKYYNM